MKASPARLGAPAPTGLVVKASCALASRFTVREFYYDETEIEREREEMTRLLSDKKQQYVST